METTRLFSFGGRLVLPGAIDGHVHFDDPGFTHRETFETGARVHVVHLASGEALAEVESARREGLPFSAETCPHYLAFTGEDLDRLGALLKTAPVVKGPADREALWAGLARRPRPRRTVDGRAGAAPRTEPLHAVRRVGLHRPRRGDGREGRDGLRARNRRSGALPPAGDGSFHEARGEALRRLSRSRARGEATPRPSGRVRDAAARP